MSAQEVPGVKEVPKIIWAYWDDNADMPGVVQFAIDSWRRCNPDWIINVLTPATLGTYVDTTAFRHVDSPQRLSDYVRLNILAKHGGVWSDASIIMTQGLDWMLEYLAESQCTFFGYYLEGFTTDMRYPVLESWFFACTPENPFVTHWRDAFMLLDTFDSIDEYITWVLLSTDIQKIDAPAYLTIHLAAQLAMQHRITDEIRETMCYLKAEDGPYKYIVSQGWESEAAMRNLCAQPDEAPPPLVKLRGSERGYVDEGMEALRCLRV
ncbi:hypothetical protein TSOC_013164 [Tetrabaena socialis]|uniref:Capsular polysaccharide synthesis protein n=1 Tax=Tetrabaena socialis TaxID=47790 RepID=A0A2J7ZL54_9CHLO|nr:hypothetical protein TSOC_013164 [Tetrabaena socialis]|eukprot:PNH00997.1 hypothetical protein TSOC_013164 [Tetrabaena socialis]